MPFLSLLPRECMSRHFFENLYMYARPIPVQTKVHFKKLQFLAVTYDMGVYKLCFRRCPKGSVFFIGLGNF